MKHTMSPDRTRLTITVDDKEQSELRHWQVDHAVLDHRGCLSLTSLRDSSAGVLAKPEDCHNCTSEEMEAIEYFKNLRS